MKDRNGKERAYLQFAVGISGVEERLWQIFLQGVVKQREDDFIKMCIYYGEICLNAIERVRFGKEKHETVIRDIGYQILPETRGRGFFPLTDGTKRILKSIYKELLSLIKKVRKGSDLYNKKTKESNERCYATMSVQDIKHNTPWVECYLTNEEMRTLLTDDTPAGIAWKILYSRLPFLEDHKINIRALQENLKGIQSL